MTLEAVLSVGTLAAVLWVVGFLLPKAVREHSAFALACTALCVVLALLAWFLMGAKTVR